MLQLSQIKDQKERVIAGLQKRGLKDANLLVREVLDIDQVRRETQLKSDNLLAEQNAVSKNIGLLMREGKKEERFTTEPHEGSTERAVKKMAGQGTGKEK